MQAHHWRNAAQACFRRGSCGLRSVTCACALTLCLAGCSPLASALLGQLEATRARCSLCLALFRVSFCISRPVVSRNCADATCHGTALRPSPHTQSLWCCHNSDVFSVCLTAVNDQQLQHPNAVVCPTSSGRGSLLTARRALGPKSGVTWKRKQCGLHTGRATKKC